MCLSILPLENPSSISLNFHEIPPYSYKITKPSGNKACEQWESGCEVVETYNESVFELVRTDDMVVTAGYVQHTAPCLGFVIEDDKSLIQQQENSARKLVILGDTWNPYNLRYAARNCDVLVHEATCEEEKLDMKAMKERGHSTASMAAKFAKDINAKSVILNHIGPGIWLQELSHGPGALSAARSLFSRPMIRAEDFLMYHLPPKH
eukprot:CAMPEP_0182444412 /NCGR_PEP_ID=MMETSP1172-20130603/2871_1 /TAXON_ID=708627 /ORGANISM="Timspurckia oligopyrenoides, Strain CCMP3278" /LENGTH=206 /DNA_ID=CAMNT_0024639961 /DNA_START=377 /DNA_END=997 /DNA_ORIENTATION=+